MTNGMTPDQLHSYFLEVLRRLHAPHTAENLKSLQVWRDCEGGNTEGAIFNPFDTTLWRPNAHPYNTFYVNGRPMHVWNYHTAQDGITATVETLLESYYTHIVEALRAGHGHIVGGPARDEMKTWGSRPDCIAKGMGY